MPQPPKNPRDLQSAIKVVQDLLGPDGCPWDKEQTPQTLTQFMIEEAHELVEAIEQDQSLAYIEELGDVLLQVLLHAEINAKRGKFTLDDVVEHLVNKLVTRHSHVYGDVRVSGASEALGNWDKQKRSEKEKKGQAHDPINIPVSMPALQRAHKIGEKAKKESFDWPTWQDVLDKCDEEIGELKQELQKLPAIPKPADLEKVRDEMGDVFFALSQLARKLKLEPEGVAREGNRKFETRFRALLKKCAENGIELKNLTDEKKEELWQSIKPQADASRKITRL